MFGMMSMIIFRILFFMSSSSFAAVADDDDAVLMKEINWTQKRTKRMKCEAWEQQRRLKWNWYQVRWFVRCFISNTPELLNSSSNVFRCEFHCVTQNSRKIFAILVQVNHLKDLKLDHFLFKLCGFWLLQVNFFIIQTNLKSRVATWIINFHLRWSRCRWAKCDCCLIIEH